MLFIPTSTTDITSDILIGMLRDTDVPIFRWNVDLWDHYELVVTDSTFAIADPRGRIVYLDDPSTEYLFRKPFFDLITSFDGGLREEDVIFVRHELKSVLYSAYADANETNRFLLVNPFDQYRLQKLRQLKVASRFFALPEYCFSIKSNYLTGSTIAKPLGDPSVGEKIFYTRLVDKDRLRRPYPWFLQRALDDGYDLTCVYIDGVSTFFKCDFKRSSEDIDWRTEINSEDQSSWSPMFAGEELSKAVCDFMQFFGLKYGRLDFIHSGNKFYFLECNPNGQFGWLDNPDLDLHRSFLRAALKYSKNYSNKRLV